MAEGGSTGAQAAAPSGGQSSGGSGAAAAAEEKKQDTAQASGDNGDQEYGADGKEEKEGNNLDNRPPGWKKDDPVTLDFLVKLWAVCYGITQLRDQCNKINLKVQAKVAGATAGFAYVVVIVKPSFVTNTVGALLDLANGALVNTFVPVRGLLNMAIRFPLIQFMLRQLRDKAFPLLQKAGKVMGGVETAKNVATKTKEVAASAKQKAGEFKEGVKAAPGKIKEGLQSAGAAVKAAPGKAKEFVQNAPDNIKKGLQSVGESIKEAPGKAYDAAKGYVGDKVDTIKGRADYARNMRSYHKENRDKYKEIGALRKDAKKDDKASGKSWDLKGNEDAANKRAEAAQKEKEYNTGAARARAESHKGFSESDKQSFVDDKPQSLDKVMQSHEDGTYAHSDFIDGAQAKPEEQFHEDDFGVDEMDDFYDDEYDGDE